MKSGIHPEVNNLSIDCACGYSFPSTSTLSEVKVTLCKKCHPFYTGDQKFVDTAGRIEKFQKRYKKASKA